VHRIKKPNLFGSGAEVTRALESLNMAVVEGTEAQLLALSKHPDVAYVEKEFFIKTPEMPLNTPPGRGRRLQVQPSEVTWGLRSVRALEAWRSVSSGSAGAGARVLILDTGIDRDHPDLKGNFEEGKNFVPKRNLLGFLKKSSAPSLLTTNFQSESASDLIGRIIRTLDDPEEASMPYDYFDIVGHGTHVAGTIAAEGNGRGVVGVAPRAKLLAGRVCGKMGCSSVAIINGIEWGIEKKVDAINMSLGGPMASRAQAEALQRAEDSGIVNVAASGNDGSAKVSYPAAFPSVIAVGATTPQGTRATFSQYGPELAVVAPGTEVKSSVPQGTGRESLVHVTLESKTQIVKSTSFVGSAENETPFRGVLVFAKLGKVEDFKDVDVRGQIALIQRGEISFADKVKNAIAAGAAGVLIFNNVDGLISGAITQDGSSVGIPVAMVEKQVGDALVLELQQGLKNEASLATGKTDYAEFQGTSMATPHTAGVVALIRAANKNLSPKQVREILLETATPIRSSPGADNEYGRGLINAEAAVRRAAAL
jgi:subtilisin family serine protease